MKLTLDLHEILADQFAMPCVDLTVSVDVDSLLEQLGLESQEIDVRDLLYENRTIAQFFTVRDVQRMRPDLNDEQAWNVLMAVDQKHAAGATTCTGCDAVMGTIANSLFPAPEDATVRTSSAKVKSIALSEEAFVALFKPLKNPFRDYASFDWGDGYGTMFETYGNEFEFVVAQDPRKIWTLCESDGCDYVVSGYHFADRLGYFISETPVPEGIEVLVELTNIDSDNN